EERSFNTSCLLSPSGEILGRYRKIHLFDVDIPGRVTVRESDARAPGAEVVVLPTELGTLGLSICYDLRFPELYRGQSRAGAGPRLLPPLPRALPAAGPCRCGAAARAVRLHLHDRLGALGGALPGTRDREPVLPPGGAPDRHHPARLCGLRALADRRSVGRGGGGRLGRRGDRAGRDRSRLPRPRA